MFAAFHANDIRAQMKKDIPLAQVASRTLLQQAQKELNIR
jgi:hypothetical protein